MRIQHGERGIVRGCRKQGISALMERGSAHSSVMVLQRLIWSGPEIQIEPHQASVIRSNGKVLAAWVHGQGTNPAGAAEQCLHRLLRNQVVHTDTPLVGDVEEWLRGAERASLNVACTTLRFCEGVHRLLLLQRMHYASIRGRLRFRAHCGAVIALHMPAELLHVPICGNRQASSRLAQSCAIWHLFPLQGLCFRALGLSLLLILFLLRSGPVGPLQQLHNLAALLDAWIHEVECAICCNCQKRMLWVPSHCCHWTRELDGAIAAPSADFPDAKSLVGGCCCQPLPSRIHGNSADHASVAFIGHGHMSWEGSEVLRIR
mmetsp:Transcript_40233/g.92496  ORF Transcript_40233/g.92496 Transcript_40233/m.92496 type:complete len:318 (+) Transcript_40233:191-1144(+)